MRYQGRDIPAICHMLNYREGTTNFTNEREGTAKLEAI